MAKVSATECGGKQTSDPAGMSSATVPGDCHPRGRRDPAASGEIAARRPGRGFGRGERGRGAHSPQVPETQRGSAGTDPRAPPGCGRPPATTPRPASPTRRAPYLAPPLLAFVRGPAALVDAAPPSPLPVWLGRRGGTGSLLTAAPLARARTARRRRRRLPPAQRGGRGNATPLRKRRRRRQRAAGARGPEGRTTAPPAARGPAQEPPSGRRPRGRTYREGGSGTRAFTLRTCTPSKRGYPGGGRWEWRRGTRKRLGQERPAGLGLRLAGGWRTTLPGGQGREWLWREPIALCWACTLPGWM